MYGWIRPADRRPGPRRGAPHGRAGALRRSTRACPRRSSRRMATSSASRPAAREARRGPRRAAGARRRRHPARRRHDDRTSGARSRVNGLIAVALPLDADGRLAGAPGRARRSACRSRQDRDDFIADADRRRRASGLRSGGDEDKVREAVRLAVRRCATLWTGKKPMVEVMRLDVDAMKLGSIIAIYFLFWVASAFILLPFGVRTDEEAGRPRSPARPTARRIASTSSATRSARRSSRRAVRALLRQLDLRLGRRRRDLDFYNPR